ncbi:MAG: TIGR03617 family F420-dependent LLM class oxidoreductase [Halobacteriota archaeon]|uniref:TIGR03617 family F420-dependent LLM class oxidoreductase n=1 Tax=Natronomonas sp. TaxID=2184060 RepID=UPI003974AFC6
MRIDAYTPSPEITEIGDIAAAAERMGFDGFWVTETKRSPYTLLTAAGSRTDDIDIGSAIAVAFPRSPMVTAYTARDIQQLTGGRLLLGLGAQVKGHMERRFSVEFEWEKPGPRLREYVQVLKHLWDVWESGGEVDFRGDFYEITLCPEDFRPEPSGDAPPEIYVAGVNPFNLKLAGDLCDGLHIHPINSPEYIEEVVVPNVEKGAAIGDRDPDEVTLSAQTFAITGRGEEREKAREAVRQQIGFYGSTRTYRTIFDVHGWGDVSDTLHDLSTAGRWDELGEHVTDEMLEAFSVEADWPDLRAALEERYEHVDRVSLYTPFDGGDRWRHLLE